MDERSWSYYDETVDPQQEALADLERDPIDWPPRFRAAAKVAEGLKDYSTGAALDDLAWRLERVASSDVVEAIGRALLGEEES